uniref:Ig-like domain-containing protein n=1 Tax=Strigamia maritima TaxID=126957 RepID=T1JIL3_STRMM
MHRLRDNKLDATNENKPMQFKNYHFIREKQNLALNAQTSRINHVYSSGNTINQASSHWENTIINSSTLTFAAALEGCRTSSVAAFDTKGPVFIYEPPNQVDFSNMTGARIECTAHGNPQPSVQWLRADGTQVVEIPSLVTVLENGTLVFRPFRAEDYRQDIHAVVYKCAATNAIGTIVSRDVKVRGVE